MSKTYHSSNRWALTGLFKRINQGDDPTLLKKESAHLMEKIDSDDIAAAQQTLIDEGYSSQMVQKISAAFVLMGLRRENTASTEAGLSDNPMLQKIFAEHALARCYLMELEQISERINLVDSLSDVSSEFRMLVQAIDHFHRFKRHIEREDDIVFPCLRRYGWKGLGRPEEAEHKIIVSDIDNLVALSYSINCIKYEKFNSYLQKIVKHFVPLLQEHLSKEEELLWPIALVVADDPGVWGTIKEICDEFEY